MSDEQLLPATPDDVPVAAGFDATAGPGAATNGRSEIAALADELLPALIARLSASSLGELEVTEGSWRVRLRRAPATVETAEEETQVGRGRGARSAHGTPVAQDGVDGPGMSGGATSGRAQAAATGRDTSRLIATSPAVGYFAPRDGAGVGQTVRSGDVLGHIDVLGVRQEVVSVHDGIVSRLLAEAGEAVEYGQELVRIERIAKGGRLGGPTDGATAQAEDDRTIGTTPASGAAPAPITPGTSSGAAPTGNTGTGPDATLDANPDANPNLVTATRAAPDVATR